jgi:hypothetical protein
MMGLLLVAVTANGSFDKSLLDPLLLLALAQAVK